MIHFQLKLLVSHYKERLLVTTLVDKFSLMINCTTGSGIKKWELGTRLVILPQCTTHYDNCHTIDDDLIEGAVCCLFCRLPGGVGHKRTLLFGHNVEVTDLTKLVKMIPMHER